MHQYAGVDFFWPSVALIDDSDAPEALNFDPAPEALSDRTFFLFKRGSPGVSAQNWHPAWAPTVLSVDVQGAYSACWDPLRRRWILALWGTAAQPLALWFDGYGADDGLVASWTALSSGAPAINGDVMWPAAVAADGTHANRWYTAIVHSGVTTPGVFLYYLTSTTGAWTLGNSFTGAAYTGAELCYHSSSDTIVAAIAGTASANSGLAYSTNQGVAWTSVNFGTLGVAVAAWLLKSNGAQIIAMPIGGNAGYFTSADGHTWTTQVSSGFLGTHDQTYGLAWGYDSTGPCWLLAVNQNTNLTPHGLAFYRSADGVNWTLSSTLTNFSNAQLFSDLAFVNGAFVCALQDYSNQGPSQTIFSTDGGVTWYYAPANFASNTDSTLTPYERPRIVASDVAMLALNGKWVRGSFAGGLPLTTL